MTQLSFIILIALYSLNPVSAKQNFTLQLDQGFLVGSTIITRGGREIFAFLGIPYAAPPVGDLRFKSPLPPPSWTGERDASKEGNDCLQQFILIEKFRNKITGSEDCLYLNVFSPNLTNTEKLPVMFFIHGGGYSGGSGALSNYGPELLLDRDIILVTINYRLGPLGFLSTGDSVLPGNLGLKDQLAALKWVQKNIEKFGGDKNSVTIFGESAGGASVHLHMLSPQSKGLFHAAISQSGSALCPWAYSSAARHKQLAAKLAQLVGCPSQPSDKFRDCLKTLPAEKIVGTLKNFIVWDMDPVVLINPAIELKDVEDAFLTSDPWTLTSTVPWLVGFNENEGALKTSSLTQGDVQSKFKRFNDDFNSILPMSLLYQDTAENPDKVTQAIKEFYFGKSENITLDMIHQITMMYTDAWFAEGIQEAARRHNGPVFVYYFSYNSSFSLCSNYFNNPEYLGVCHFDELLYLFPMEGHAPKLVLNDPDYIVSSRMVELWTNYASMKIPGFDNAKEIWKSKYGSTTDFLLISKDGFDIHQHLISERDSFWRNLPHRNKPPVHHQRISDEF